MESGHEQVKYESSVITVPDAAVTILPNDTLIVAGSNEALSSLLAERESPPPAAKEGHFSVNVSVADLTAARPVRNAFASNAP